MADDTITFLQELVILLEARLYNEQINRQTEFDRGYVAGLSEAKNLAVKARDEELS